MREAFSASIVKTLRDARIAPSRVRGPSLFWNAASNWAGLGVNLVVGFLLTPFIIAHVGKGIFGIWTLVGSIVGYYGLLDLGIGTAIGRFVAYHAGRKDAEALSQTVSTAFLILAALGLVVLLCSVALVRPLASFFAVPQAEFTVFRNVIWILGANLAIEFPGKIFRATIRAHELYVSSNVIVIAGALCRAGVAVWLLVEGFGLAGVASAYLVTNIVTITLHWTLCRRALPDLQIRPSVFSRGHAAALVTFGGTSLVIAIADLLRFKLDIIIIGKFMDLQRVADYGIATLLIRYYFQSLTAGFAVISPRFARYEGASEREALTSLLMKSLWISAILAAIGACALILAGKWLILLWVGSEFAQAFPVLVVLAASMSVALAQVPAVIVLYALNRHRIVAGLVVAEALLNLAISLVLVHKYGLIGVALGTAIPMILLKTIIQPIYVSRCVGVSLYSVYVRLAPAGMVLLFTLWIFWLPR